MNVHSKEFWGKVKKEYDPSLSKYICHTSNYFCVVWDSRNRSEIIKLAKQFLKYNFWKFRYWSTSTGTVLFINGSEKTRIEFIDWCIKKYSK